MTQRIIETNFTARDNASATMKAMGSQAKKTEDSLAQLTNSFNQMWGAVKGGAAAYVGIGALKNMGNQIIDVGQKAEQAKISLAGILSGQGIASNFQDGLIMAESTLTKIAKDAAVLPGTAEEFQSAFQTAAGSIGASGLKLEEFIGLSNKLTATAKIFGEDSAQAGRDIGLLINGRAGMDVTLWSKLNTYMGYTVADAAKFNKLAPEKRMEKLFSVVGRGAKDQGKLGDMIKEYATTWDAVSSTVTSTGKEIFKIATAPLFEKAKENVGRIANWLGEHEGVLKSMAGGVGNKVSEMLTPAAMVGMAGSVLGKVAFGFGPVGMMMSGLAAKIVVGDKSMEELGESALALVHRFEPLVTRAGAFAGLLYDKLEPALSHLVETLGETAFDALDAFIGVIVDNKDALITGLTGLVEGVSWAAEKLGWFVKNAPAAVGAYVNTNEQEAAGMADRLFGQGDHGFMATGLSRTLAYTNYLGLGGVLGGEETINRDTMAGAANQEQSADIYAKGQEIQAHTQEARLWSKEMKRLEYALFGDGKIMGFNTDYKDLLRDSAANTANATGDQAKSVAELYAKILNGGIDFALDHPELFNNQGIQDLMLNQMAWDQQVAEDADMGTFIDPIVNALNKAPVEQKIPKKPTVNQDFRGSRFDIKQQFPDGMDPDRVAVAFRRDIENIGQRKLQSTAIGAIMGL